MIYNNYKFFITKQFIISLLYLIIIGCSSPNEEPPINDDSDNQINNLDGPVADACPDVNYPYWKTSPYVLPYPVGKAYKIDLSNCMGYYHGEGKPDQFAIDFNMKIGTTITASRSGKVVFVEESGFDGSHPNNLIVIDHGNKTFAQYMHLTYKGSLVEVGDDINKGDEIGLSGNTGLAGYPHLHFVVTKDSWAWPYESIPVTFSNTLSNAKSLKSETIYEAFPY